MTTHAPTEARGHITNDQADTFAEMEANKRHAARHLLQLDHEITGHLDLPMFNGPPRLSQLRQGWAQIDGHLCPLCVERAISHAQAVTDWNAITSDTIAKMINERVSFGARDEYRTHRAASLDAVLTEIDAAIHAAHCTGEPLHPGRCA